MGQWDGAGGDGTGGETGPCIGGSAGQLGSKFRPCTHVATVAFAANIMKQTWTFLYAHCNQVKQTLHFHYKSALCSGLPPSFVICLVLFIIFGHRSRPLSLQTTMVKQPGTLPGTAAG